MKQFVEVMYICHVSKSLIMVYNYINKNQSCPLFDSEYKTPSMLVNAILESLLFEGAYRQ